MQEINLIFGARNGEFRITTIMLNERYENPFYFMYIPQSQLFK